MFVSIADALNAARDLASESARLDTELLLAEALGQRREYLLTHPEAFVSEEQLARFHSALQRRESGEPVAYILGRKGFWDFELEVTPAVLIPRPETELIVEQVLELYGEKSREVLTAVDLGTGSGALAIALARANPDWRVIGVDNSQEAIEVAGRNAARLSASVQFSCSNWCDSLLDNSCDLIVANPPYVRGDDEHLQRDGLAFEPGSALVAQEQGMADLKQIIISARRCLKESCWLLLEHGYDQRQAVADQLQAAGYVDIHCQADYAGNDRMSRARWPGQ